MKSDPEKEGFATVEQTERFGCYNKKWNCQRVWNRSSSGFKYQQIFVELTESPWSGNGKEKSNIDGVD